MPEFLSALDWFLAGILSGMGGLLGYFKKRCTLLPKRVRLVRRYTICTSLCRANVLTDCTSGRCHICCLDLCGCGAGRRVLELIKTFGSIREAELALSSGEKIPRKVKPVPAGHWKEGDEKDEKISN
jgi:hypothetical protein